MSTTIRRWARGALSLALVIACWFALLVAMPFLGDPGRQVAILGDHSAALRAVAASRGQVIAIRGRAVLARSGDPDFVRSLYRNGAGFIVEGRVASGCLGIQLTASPLKAGA